MSDHKRVTQLRPAIGADKQPHTEEELAEQGRQTSAEQPHLRAQEEMQQRVQGEQKEASTVVTGEPGGLYDASPSEDDITRNDDTMSKTPGSKPSQAEGSRDTVEQDLAQKNDNS